MHKLARARTVLVFATALLASVSVQAQDEGWVVDVSVFMLGAAMDGTIGIAGHDADIDVSFSDIVENLEMGGMGSMRVARGRWAFTTEVIYMGLGASDGPFGRNPSGTVDWWDPIIGARWILPIGEAWTFNLRGDVGGFGVGSDFAWQLFPYMVWQFGERASMQAGYRAVSGDYYEGSGLSEFKYDVVTQGPQLGVIFRF